MITSPCGTEGPKGVVPPCVNLYKVNHGTRTSHSGVQLTYQQTIPSHIHVCPYTCPYTCQYCLNMYTYTVLLPVG